MTDLKWKQEALDSFPCKLTPDQKKQITKISPWAPFPEVEKICSSFLYWRNFMSTRQSKADTLLYFYGDKNEAGYIAKLKKSFEANIDVMRTFDKASPWLSMRRTDPLFTSLQKVNAQLLFAITRAEKQAQDYRTNRSQASIPEHYLVMALADLYHEITGLEVARNNPCPATSKSNTGPSEQSSLAEIINTLDSTLNCGPCTGHITKIIRTRKEINDLEQGL